MKYTVAELKEIAKERDPKIKGYYKMSKEELCSTLELDCTEVKKSPATKAKKSPATKAKKSPATKAKKSPATKAKKTPVKEIKLNIYRISQRKNHNWDTYDSAIVAAPTEDIARRIHPSLGIVDEKRWAEYREWAYKYEQVKVELIGVAAKGIKQGVILASFNAG